MPSEEKRRRADEVIDCSGTVEHTRAQVIALFAKLKGMQSGKSKNPSVRS
jgi:dephospho-CoA kinase